MAPAAQAQARKTAAWWRDHRPSAPDLFEDEMAAVLVRLAEAPKTGLPYRTVRARPIRRLLMVRCSYNVYFEIHDERALVQVMAVWHAARGHGRPL